MVKALLCKSISKNVPEAIEQLSFEEIQSEKVPLESGQLRIKVSYAGLNFFDLLQFVGRYQSKPSLPFSPCSEGSGDIIEVHPSEKRWKVGDRVIFFFEQAAKEEVIIPVDYCLPLPDCLSYQEGAGFYVGYMTAYHALVQRGNLKPKEVLLITGAAGGMGIMACQIAKIIGATVIGVVGSDKKAEVLKRYGVDHVINYNTETVRTRVSELTDGHMCDVIYESVGGKMFDECVKCITPQGGGRILVIGFASGTIPKLSINMALIKGFSLVGVRSGAQLHMFDHSLRDDCHRDLVKWAKEGKLKSPINGQEFEVTRAKEAFRLIFDKKVIGKAVIKMTPSSKL